MHSLKEGTAYRLGRRTTRGQGGGMSNTGGEGPSLWDRVLRLVERDLDERRVERFFVQVHSESGQRRKEIGELSAEERRGLDPALRERVVERLLERYLAEQGRVDLADKRRAYTKKVRDLTPEDLPALVQADRQRTEEEHERERERAELVRAARGDLERLVVV